MASAEDGPASRLAAAKERRPQVLTEDLAGAEAAVEDEWERDHQEERAAARTT